MVKNVNKKNSIGTAQKTRTYIMLFRATKWLLPRKSWILNITCENELIVDFIGQNETKYIRISILLLSASSEKTTENKSERHM